MPRCRGAPRREAPRGSVDPGLTHSSAGVARRFTIGEAIPVASCAARGRAPRTGARSRSRWRKPAGACGSSTPTAPTASSAALQRRGWGAVLYGGDGPNPVPARKALALVRLADPHLPFLAVSPFVHAGDLKAVVRGLDGDAAVVPDPARAPARAHARARRDAPAAPRRRRAPLPARPAGDHRPRRGRARAARAGRARARHARARRSAGAAARSGARRTTAASCAAPRPGTAASAAPEIVALPRPRAADGAGAPARACPAASGRSGARRG